MSSRLPILITLGVSMVLVCGRRSLAHSTTARRTGTCTSTGSLSERVSKRRQRAQMQGDGLREELAQEVIELVRRDLACLLLERLGHLEVKVILRPVDLELAVTAEPSLAFDRVQQVGDGAVLADVGHVAPPTLVGQAVIRLRRVNDGAGGPQMGGQFQARQIGRIGGVQQARYNDDHMAQVSARLLLGIF